METDLNRRLNLGCGDRFIDGWANVDFKSRSPKVTEYDLREPLPFADRSFSVVYHSHVLEHLDPKVGRRMLGECHRVLEPGGILRVVVPDLEMKAKLYLEKLQAAATPGNVLAADQHEWMLLEVIDQLVRTQRGGAMAEFMRSGRAADFVRGRIGDEYERARRPFTPPAGTPKTDYFAIQLRRVRRKLISLLGITADEQDDVEFRRIGETHSWMYDRVSLANLLREIGFAETRQESANTSRIPGWTGGADYLDVDASGARKPDSLYMEGLRP